METVGDISGSGLTGGWVSGGELPRCCIRTRSCLRHVSAELGVSERVACQAREQHRPTQRKAAKRCGDEAALD